MKRISFLSIVTAAMLFLFASQAFCASDGWNMSGNAKTLYDTITGVKEWMTVDDAGNPVKCTFYGHDDEELSGVVMLAYTTWENKSEVTRRETLFWRIIQGDTIDIQANYFCISSGGQMVRIAIDTQRCWPASW